MSSEQYDEHQHHGLLDKVKGLYSHRPSGRDRATHCATHEGDDKASILSDPSTHDGERGRESRDVMVSTGRGGAGNIRPLSQSRARDNDTDEGEVEARARSKERSRERGALGGRGGAGNFRSASRTVEERAKDDEEARMAAEEERLAQEKWSTEDATHVHSYGRGGAGNVR